MVVELPKADIGGMDRDASEATNGAGSATGEDFGSLMLGILGEEADMGGWDVVCAEDGLAENVEDLWRLGTLVDLDLETRVLER